MDDSAADSVVAEKEKTSLPSIDEERRRQWMDRNGARPLNPSTIHPHLPDPLTFSISE